MIATSKTWQKLSTHNWFLAIAAGVSVFLAFERFNFLPSVFLFPILFNRLTFQKLSLRQSFLFGYLTSFVIMLGGFYWVTYVIHEFGYLPWSISALLFLGFCTFGALCFPIFTLAASYIHQKIDWKKTSPLAVSLWFGLGLPSLFTFIEWWVPKLFPWYLGHCFYRQLSLIQISEITGSSFLSFSLYSLASVLGLYLFPPIPKSKFPRMALAIPLLLWVLQLGFGQYRLANSLPRHKEKTFALIQPNIGSLEKMEAEKGYRSKVIKVLEVLKGQTRKAIAETPKPDLVLWPETALPFQMESYGPYQTFVKNLLEETKVPILTGAYAQSPINVQRDYNAAFLLEPTPAGLKMDIYQKNILLMFGEYLPLGDAFPILYKYFPQVSDFERGKTQKIFTMLDGTRLGVSICYEAIVPAFFRKITRQSPQILINLTNDSWFGPTAEPYLHGSLTVFRAVESRLPFLRVTNTGVSFAVSALGEISELSPLHQPSTQNFTVAYQEEPQQTFYTKLGDWFIILLALAFALSYLLLKRRHVSVPF